MSPTRRERSPRRGGGQGDKAAKGGKGQAAKAPAAPSGKGGWGDQWWGKKDKGGNW